MREPTLSYVALAARDTDAVHRFLSESLQLQCSYRQLGDRSVAFYAVGRAAVAVFSVDDPYLEAPRFAGVHHMALAVSDPDACAMRSGLPVTHTGVGPDGQAFVALAPAATGGIRTRLVPASDCPQAVGAVSRIDHLGIASEDIDANVRIFVDALGCPLESSETDIELRHVTESFVSDKYGAVYRSRPTEILGGLRGVFVTVGDCELEIMMDYDPQLQPLTDLGHAQGNTKGDQSAIANFIARRGPGLVHVAFRTNDIDAMMAKLGAEGWRVIDQSGRPGGRASRIAFVHPSNFGGGVLLHFVEPHASEPRASE